MSFPYTGTNAPLAVGIFNISTINQPSCSDAKVEKAKVTVELLFSGILAQPDKHIQGLFTSDF